MPFAVKKPHPQHPNVKVWHTWDPDLDGYEEVRKWVTRANAEKWVAENHPNKNCEIVEIGYEASQDENEIAQKEIKQADPNINGGVLTNFTPLGDIED